MRKNAKKNYSAAVNFAALALTVLILFFAAISCGCTESYGTVSDNFVPENSDKNSDKNSEKNPGNFSYSIISDSFIFDDEEPQFAYANGIKTGYKQAGEGPHLVMVMGYAATMDAWSPSLLNSLAENYTVTIFDNRGAGLSGPGDIQPENMTYEIYADDTAALMDALGIKKAYLFGWSMGTAISQELLLKYPDRVEKAVLYAPYYSLSSPGQEHLREYLRIVAYNEVTESDVYENMFPKEWLLCNKPAKYLPSSQPVSQRGILAEYHAGLNWNGTLNRLSRINIPVLLTAGSDDSLTPPEYLRAMAEEIDGSWTAEFKGAGHGLMYQNPNVLADTVRFFLEIDEDLSCV